MKSTGRVSTDRTVLLDKLQPRARFVSGVSLDNSRNLSQQKLHPLTSGLSYINYFTRDSNNILRKAMAGRGCMNHYRIIDPSSISCRYRTPFIVLLKVHIQISHCLSQIRMAKGLALYIRYVGFFLSFLYRNSKATFPSRGSRAWAKLEMFLKEKPRTSAW